jgi:hypothetical protein
MISAVIYASKSTDVGDDGRTEETLDSISDQIKDCEAAIQREERQLLDTFHEDAVSAYKGNRGPKLAAALALAERAADEHGEAELWVQHSDRLARGDGRKGGARHLGGLYFECRQVGIRLRSMQDDGNLEDAIRAVLIGERNYEDSRRRRRRLELV